MEDQSAKKDNVTVQDVAREAGVSASTVSRYLTGVTGVSKIKQEAISRAIDLLNFTPNVLAQSLKTGSTKTIGIITQDLGSPFFGEELKGVEHAISGTGYALLIVSGHWQSREEKDHAELLIGRRVDGIIIFTATSSDKQILALSRQIPVVITGRRLDALPRALGLAVDNEMAAFEATQYLLSQGHRRIAHICGRLGQPDAEERLQGYKRALEAAGIAVDQRLIASGDFTETGGVLAINQLLESRSPFTAIFAANDQSALGARLGLYRRGIRVPEEISLIGFDDLAVSNYMLPPLTTIRQPTFDLGRLAGQTLLGMLQGSTTPVVQPQFELVKRESVRRV
ncbi:LacI family DNA-binding transcriptional regulator [Silvimonas iriomotensis]|uniref:LacI family transcriptional regulator n=1 Tax=Silvimonas iriomotensis TaxID=449662 RepID=A0ABQ2P492_9NEIS|nr:substrate-binding domain-containing protein [Silvimonas iriomotensis]GGP17843.1 LacI family transcriptional regulator [Silvimonas iriomotensis]